MAKAFRAQDRMTDISDAAFWRALRVPPRRKGTAGLGQAIKLGRAGDYDAAWLALADYHRHALAGEWQVIRERHLKHASPSATGLADLLAHRINCWHTQRIEFGPTIDWFPEALPSDCKHGFHYLHWARPAVIAFVQTGEEPYREFLRDLWRQWYYGARQDPRWREQIRHLIYTCLGVAGKWPAFLPSFIGLLQAGERDPQLLAAFYKTLLGFGRALRLHFPVFIPGVNALAVGATTLLHLARLFPEFDESPDWDRHALRLQFRQSRDSFYPDGGNRERVWGYGLMHLHGLQQAYDLAQRYGGLGRYERPILETIQRACQWYAKSAGPDPAAYFPTYGDAGTDNGLHQVGDCSRFFPPGTPAPAGVDRGQDYLLDSSGFAIMRNGAHPTASYANLNFGEFGGWHSHWDLLSLNFWSQGERLLDEVCRFGPYANPLDTLFRAPEMHNLVLIDGMVYDNRLVKGEDVAWHSDDQVAYFSAYHRAYRYFIYGRDNGKVSPNIEGIVRRTVLMVKDPGYLVVLDSVGNHRHAGFNRAISQYWHSPQPFQVLGRDRVRTAGDRSCLLLWGQPESLHRLDAGVDFAGAEVAHLGVAEDRYNLRARRWLPVTHKGITGFTTILYPFTGTVPDLRLVPVASTGGSPWRTEALELHGPFGVDRITLNPERLPDFQVAGTPSPARARFQRQGQPEIRVD